MGHVTWLSARLSSDTADEKRTYSRGNAALTVSIEALLDPIRIDVDGPLGYSVSSHDFFGGIRGMVGASLWGPIEIGLGYRWERFDVSGGTNVAALTVHGPTAALAIRF